MEKAILKTLIYADIFEYPLKAYEIHKWLVGRRVSLRQVEKALERLRVKGKAERVKDFYVLPGRSRLVSKRLSRAKQSAKLLFKAKFVVWFLKVIPFIKLVGISGGLAMNNADKKDDIDLFLVTSKNRLWLTRFLVIGLLAFLGVRRKVKMKRSQVAGKLCPNIIVEEEKLVQDNKDIFTAHEVLQMKVLWSRGGVYSKYLADNEWAFKFLPNWISDARGPVSSQPHSISSTRYHSLRGLNGAPRSLPPPADWLENLAKYLQLKIMRKPKGMERIQDGALYFHPQDIRPKILKLYKQKLAGLDN